MLRRSTPLLALLLLAACSAQPSPTPGATPATVLPSAASSTPTVVPSTPPSPPPLTAGLTATIVAATPTAPVSLPPEQPTPVALRLETTPATPAASLAGRTPKLADVKNLSAITEAYGITLTAAQRSALEQQGIIQLPLSATTINPEGRGSDREFPGLYTAVRGSTNAFDRTQANSILYTSDIFLSTYNRLFEELIKEVENTAFFPSMRDTSARLYAAAGVELAAATNDADRARWAKVRDYFAVPHCLLQNAAGAPDVSGMTGDETSAALRAFGEADATTDSREKVESCVKGLKLGADEAVVLAQVAQVYATEGAMEPVLFEAEFQEYAERTGKEFKVDFTQFTPRSHYTGTSLRRQYFRAMSWYIQLPFFLRQPELSSYAFSIASLLAKDPKALADYQRLERTIVFLVGASDDLRPSDYLRALEAGRGKPQPAVAALAFLDQARNPQVKSLGATYQSVGTEQTADVLDLTKGMRFFSGKVLRDTTWTSRLTQGDEAPLPGFTQKLPPMASALEVQSLLGSTYAGTQVDTLPFVTAQNRDAVHQMLGQLATETSALPDAAWQGSTYHLELWGLQGMYQWQDANRAALPAFMRSPAWDAKTLQTGSGAWTELRHATLLYAKQSFAEMGAGWDSPCDPGKLPEPAKGYIEPQPVLYDRMLALAYATDDGLKAQGFTGLRNAAPLTKYATLLGTVRGYTARELRDETLVEKLDTKQVDDPDKPGKKCTVTTVSSSDWETLRLLTGRLVEAQPVVVEGDYIQNKDRRAAIVADVHTGGDSTTPPFPKQTRILYEALGVPNVVIALVQDANGPRAVIGFTFRHHEFTEPHGGPRKTDEDWQKGFYEADEYDAFKYTDPKTWPAQPSWYAPLNGPATTGTSTPVPTSSAK